MKTQIKFSQRNTTTATVCHYVQSQTHLSMRAMARALNIHHRTWQRYLKSQSCPDAIIKRKLVRIMRTGSYQALIKAAFGGRTRIDDS